MPVDFDDADIAEVVEEVESGIATGTGNGGRFVGTGSEALISDEEGFEEAMSEVEARLELAQYYQLLLKEDLFAGNDSPVAERVQEEIRAFVRTRMQVLVGVGEPTPKAQPKLFSDAEVQAIRTLSQPEVAGALKALAAKVLKKPAILDAKPLAVEKPKPVEPVLKEPVLRKITKKPAGASQAPPPAIRQTRVQKGAIQRKVVIDVKENGAKFERDLTPQARPVGPIQPIPTPRSKHQIEAAAEVAARHGADEALNQLNAKLTGR